MEDARVVEQIAGLAQNIAAIADQTNLLALNAAIEAARLASTERFCRSSRRKCAS